MNTFLALSPFYGEAVHRVYTRHLHTKRVLKQGNLAKDKFMFSQMAKTPKLR